MMVPALSRNQAAFLVEYGGPVTNLAAFSIQFEFG
jgi:hypothetical protein